jgi:hypothetical protein
MSDKLTREQLQRAVDELDRLRAVRDETLAAWNPQPFGRREGPENEEAIQAAYDAEERFRELMSRHGSTLLDAARFLLDQQPASDEQILEVTMPALWMSTRPPKYDVAAELDQFAINCYRDAEARLLLPREGREGGRDGD